jgi:hypothetical protein
MNALNTNKFRTKFELGVKLTKWFPRHMNKGLNEFMINLLIEKIITNNLIKGLREMGRTLKKVDCILEVHDSRISFSLNLKILYQISIFFIHFLNNHLSKHSF